MFFKVELPYSELLVLVKRDVGECVVDRHAGCDDVLC